MKIILIKKGNKLPEDTYNKIKNDKRFSFLYFNDVKNQYVFEKTVISKELITSEATRDSIYINYEFNDNEKICPLTLKKDNEWAIIYHTGSLSGISGLKEMESLSDMFLKHLKPKTALNYIKNVLSENNDSSYAKNGKWLVLYNIGKGIEVFFNEKKWEQLDNDVYLSEEFYASSYPPVATTYQSCNPRNDSQKKKESGTSENTSAEETESTGSFLTKMGNSMGLFFGLTGCHYYVNKLPKFTNSGKNIFRELDFISKLEISKGSKLTYIPVSSYKNAAELENEITEIINDYEDNKDVSFKLHMTRFVECDKNQRRDFVFDIFNPIPSSSVETKIKMLENSGIILTQESLSVFRNSKNLNSLRNFYNFLVKANIH